MSHYKSNVRDLEFNLFEWLNRGEILGDGLYDEVDEDVVREMLHEMARLAENELAASLLDSDRCPPTFDPQTHTATLPQSFKDSYQAYLNGEWWRMAAPVSCGGTLVPPSVQWALNEMVLGSNPAIHMYSAGYAFAQILHDLGTPEQQRLAELIVDNHWGATMVLTEPDAGSDVGAGRTKAVQQADGSWHVSGVKRFITSGDADLFENTIHFVLARPEGAGPGTKGLSLFLVPKFHYDAQSGELGDRNGAYVTNVEHKMGLKVSTTCEVRFGEVNETPAVGYLLGDVHNGISQMFKIIEFARMMVGTKAIATLSTGYLNALEYAKERVQGPDLTQAADKEAPRVTITAHPDVRRSLMLQKAYAEGLRALVLYTASFQDKVELASGQRSVKEAEPGSAADLPARVNDLLLPIVKGVGSERAYVLLGTESLQTLGGSGFLQDYPLEQYVRDAKIDTLYEGTTAIQGMDFFFRKIVKDEGVALGYLAKQITEFLESGDESDGLAQHRGLLATAVDDLQAMVGSMIEVLMQSAPQGGDVRNLYRVGQNTTRLLLCAGDVVVGWLLLQQAQIAAAKLADGSAGKDEAFYTGKVAAAKFFAATVLPRVTAERVIAQGVDNALMDVPEEAF